MSVDRIKQIGRLECTNYITNEAMSEVEIRLCIRYGLTAQEDIWNMEAFQGSGDMASDNLVMPWISDEYCVLTDVSEQDIYGDCGCNARNEDYETEELIAAVVEEIANMIDDPNWQDMYIDEDEDVDSQWDLPGSLNIQKYKRDEDTA
jgi:hypothetical protein